MRPYVFTSTDKEGQRVRGIVEATNSTAAMQLARADTRFQGARIRDLKVATREDVIENALRFALASAERIEEIFDDPQKDALEETASLVAGIIATAKKAL